MTDDELRDQIASAFGSTVDEVINDPMFAGYDEAVEQLERERAGFVDWLNRCADDVSADLGLPFRWTEEGNQ
jgi:hypothetical protein